MNATSRPDRPTAVAVAWDSIPLSLRSLTQWVAWEFRWLANRAAWAKVPLDIRGVSASDGYSRAKSDNSRTWTTFDRVRAEWDRIYSTFHLDKPCGPGFVFRAGGGFVGIDLDKCRNPETGELNEFAQNIVLRFPGYWEVSPSGKGLKGIFYGAIPGEGKGRKLDFPEGHGIEIYDRGRYFAITGQRIEGASADITSCADRLQGLVVEIDETRRARLEEKRKNRPQRATRTTSTPRVSGPCESHDLSAKIRRARAYTMCREGAVAKQHGDDRTFATACVLVLGFDLTPDQAMPIMREWNEVCRPMWPDEWLWRKVTQADLEGGDRGYLLHADRPFSRPIGYEDLTPAEVNELIRGLGSKIGTDLTSQPVVPDAAPDDCAIHAAEDVANEIKFSRELCQNKSPIMMAKEDGAPFVCDRPCGNGTKCRACLNSRLYTKVGETNAYLIRTSVTSPERRAVYAALVDSVQPGNTRWNTLTNAVRDRQGERCSVLTEDAIAVAERLGRDPGTSRFFLEDNKVEGESGTARLWSLSLPSSAAETITFAGVIFRRVPVANLIRAIHHAVKTVPSAPDDGTIFKPYHDSSGWGDKEVQQPTRVKVVRPSKFGVKRTKQILDQSEVISRSVEFDRRHGSEPGVGWQLSGVSSLAMELWLGGVDAPFVPTVDRVVSLAQHWLPQLPADVGSGFRVQLVLRQHIWNHTLFDITSELRAAHEEDLAQEAAQTEASSLYAALCETYRGREHEAVGLVADLLA